MTLDAMQSPSGSHNSAPIDVCALKLCSKPVTILDDLDAASFEELRKPCAAEPALVRGVTRNWSLFEWQLHDFARELDEEVVQAWDFQSDPPTPSLLNFRALVDKLLDGASLYLTWRGLPTPSQYLQLAATGSASPARKKLKAMESSGGDACEKEASDGLMRLCAAMPLPHFLADVNVIERNLWFGKCRSSGLHFDGMDNLLCVTSGRKSVYLYAPSEITKLHPRGRLKLPIEATMRSFDEMAYLLNSAEDRSGTQSFLREAAMARASVPFISADLRAGDALFIPAGWWHEVFTPSITVAVNFWFPASEHASWRPTLLYLHSAQFAAKVDQTLASQKNL